MLILAAGLRGLMPLPPKKRPKLRKAATTAVRKRSNFLYPGFWTGLWILPISGLALIYSVCPGSSVGRAAD